MIKSSSMPIDFERKVSVYNCCADFLSLAGDKQCQPSNPSDRLAACKTWGIGHHPPTCSQFCRILFYLLSEICVFFPIFIFSSKWCLLFLGRCCSLRNEISSLFANLCWVKNILISADKISNYVLIKQIYEEEFSLWRAEKPSRGICPSLWKYELRCAESDQLIGHSFVSDLLVVGCHDGSGQVCGSQLGSSVWEFLVWLLKVVLVVCVLPHGSQVMML